ncbi:hypothetical protein KMP13_11880 [Epibacterium ulvae]|uniref:hypothetical protein n=1 Tax=Epibacterium ulvae TaxID=1156985 RepID=UPI001BFC3CFE|nr:hypothetical protein [Epibacterium ulvae]MBT8154584.1 hypothetical protein [Epibacterium ulvae]
MMQNAAGKMPGGGKQQKIHHRIHDEKGKKRNRKAMPRRCHRQLKQSRPLTNGLPSPEGHAVRQA